VKGNKRTTSDGSRVVTRLRWLLADSNRDIPEPLHGADRITEMRDQQ
jgi:hypothetical protein